nr:hypothetical protein [Microbacterium bovistercoris]
MSVRWQNEVERPWVGMTTESMTDVERSRAELAAAVSALKAKLRGVERIRPRLLPAVDTRRLRRVATIIAVIAGVALLVVARRHRRRADSVPPYTVDSPFASLFFARTVGLRF